jgi:hypothetical protein
MTEDRPRRKGPAIRPDGTLRPDTYRDDPDTGCRIWLKRLKRDDERGTPQASNGTTTVLVRTELWRIHRGTPLTIGAGALCGNPRCVAVDHLFDGKTPHLSLNQQAEITRLGGQLATAQIAARLGVSDFQVRAHLKRQGAALSGPTHPAARRYAGSPLPPQPASITDPHWDIFVHACQHTYAETGEAYGMTKQGVALIVMRVLAAIDQNA